MTQKEMWEAVKNNNKDFDGIFFYGVKTTGIFCRPSCKSKLPKAENVCFFKTAAEARKAGFRPCKRCRSDLLEYNPIVDIAKDTKNSIDNTEIENTEIENTNINFNSFGVTSRRLNDIFKNQYGTTPKKYMDTIKINKAKAMLKNTDEKIIDIAYCLGFSNQSSFNRFFKKFTGKTPSEYRKENKDNLFI